LTFKDIEDYIKELTWNMEVESVLDVGTGNKGVVAQHYWENIKKIRRGYACDIWVIKPLPPVWTPLKMNALDLLKVLKPKSVDVVQACGFLEHLSKLDGYRFLRIAETLARKLVFTTSAHWLLIGEGEALRIDRFKGSYKFALDYKEHGKPVTYFEDLTLSTPSKVVQVQNGNPYHRYRSTWSWSEFEELGYEANVKDAFSGKSFTDEVVAWKFIKGF